jgi:ketosteroid isomerase-like protein
MAAILRAMSQQNVELIKRVLGEAQHNPDALWEVLDDEVLWEPGHLDIPDAGPTHWRGPAGVQEFFHRWIGPFDDWGYEVGEMIDAGDSVVAHIHQWGRGKWSGAKVESQFWLVWTIRDGKLVHGRHYTERADALAAAGVGEPAGPGEQAERRPPWAADHHGADVMRRRLG